MATNAPKNLRVSDNGRSSQRGFPRAYPPLCLLAAGPGRGCLGEVPRGLSGVVGGLRRQVCGLDGVQDERRGVVGGPGAAWGAAAAKCWGTVGPKGEMGGCRRGGP